MRWLVACVCACTFACVDGKTPDCSFPDSGCFPNADASSQADAGDASSDASPDAVVGDAETD